MVNEFCNVIGNKTIESFVSYQKQFEDYPLFRRVIKLLECRVRAGE